VKKKWGPAAGGLPPRLLAALAAAAALALGLAGCSHGADRPRRPPGPLSEALSYLPARSGIVAVILTDPGSGPLKRLDRLGSRFKGWDRVKRELRTQIETSGLRFDEIIRPQLGYPFALGVGGTGQPVGALRVRDPPALRVAVEARLSGGEATRLDDYKGAFVWKATGAGGASTFAAIAGNDLVVARSEQDLKEAIEADKGSNSLAFDRLLTAELSKLDSHALVRVVGDSQRLLDRDPGQAQELRQIRWMRALGTFSSVFRIGSNDVRIDFRLRTDRERLAESDLPIPPGPAAPLLHEPGATAAFAVLDPDRVVRFLEKVSAVTDPDGFSRYESAVGQLRAFFGVDLHKDLLSKVSNLSVAFPRGAALTFEARLRDRAVPAVARALATARPALEAGLGDFVPGATINESGSARRHAYVVRRGAIALARYGVRGAAIVGSIGFAKLPRRVRGSRPRGAIGALVAKGDLGRIGRLVGTLLAIPKEALDSLSRLGDLTLSVRAETSGLTGRARLAVGKSRFKS
jgi:hypothetical protein